MMNSRIAIYFVVLISVLLAPVPFACGPEPTRLVFTAVVHPDAPHQKYFSGDLGIIQPTYARVYLYAAYRHLSGVALTRAEQELLARYWGHHPNPAPPRTSNGTETTWFEGWERERRKSAPAPKPLPGVAEGVYRMASQGSYSYYLNCPPDAFRNATNTLVDRRAKFGEASAELHEWIKAQDMVFENCGSGSQVAVVPAQPDATWNALLRADRAYQIGAALFYAAEFDAAARQFDSVAGDAESPWRTIAPYLAARALLRKSTLGKEMGFDRDPMVDAERRLKAVVADAEQKEFHPAARRLMGFVSFRLNPVERRQQLAAFLLSPELHEGKMQALVDYTKLLDSHDVAVRHDTSSENAVEESAKRYQDAAALLTEPLTGWILTFQAQSPEATRHSLEKWKATKSLPWLVAAISKVDADNSESETLLNAASKVEKGSPAYATVSFHRARLLLEKRLGLEARQLIDSLLADKSTQSPSARSLLRAARMKAAQGIDELAAFAPRPVRSGWGSQSESLQEAGTQFDADFSAIFNQQLPLEKIVELARLKLPLELHRSVVLAAWTRAVLLERHEVALALSDDVEKVAPQTQHVLRDYRSARSPQARRYLATYAVLSFPPLTPNVHVGPERKQQAKLSREVDHWKDNWWCKDDGFSDQMPPFYGWRAGFVWNSAPLRSLYPRGAVDAPSFLSSEDIAKAASEKQHLDSIVAPTYLTSSVLEWAKNDPANPLIPEALHRAINAARWSCGNEETAKYSKAAFELLHSRYAKTPWAKKTKYWYGVNP